MEFLLEKAYDAVNFRIAGPAWLNSERFDVDATMPPSTTKAQFQIMLQNLLAERFKLAMHRETRELPGYSLVVAKNGPKFKESAGELAAQDENAPDPPLRLGLDGYFVPPQRPGIFLQMSRPPGAHSTFRQVTMQMLASSLQSQLRRPVGNATGLTAKYDFVLNFSTEGLDLGSGRIPVSPGDADPPPDIFSALPSQLGLILESKKGPAEVIVIDHVEKAPIEN
ncbi:MAG TPA: TIGR03435 family protein, partial [Candidatus Sulfopaludibacter sp.]|nr:TIGR03435 family protein [Candidatus Sulfopaludibacter sp.]